MLLTVMLASTPPETAPLPRRVPILSVRAIRALSMEEASLRQPVRITGVVTFANPTVLGFFVQDSSEGIYVMPSELCRGLVKGDRVVVEGVTDPGDFAPCVQPERIQVLSHDAPLPVPLPFTMAPEDARWLDGQFVQIWGVVEKVSEWKSNMVISFYNAQGRANVIIPGVHDIKGLQSLVNAALTIKGVCVPAFDRTDRTIRLDATRLYTNSFPMLGLSQMEPKNTQAIDHLLRFTPDPHPGARRVTVTGTIVGIAAPGTLYVQDTSGGIAVLPPTNDISAHIGQRVEATGLVAIEGRRIRMLHATLRGLGEADLPTPAKVSIASLALGRHFATLTSTMGRVDQVSTHDAMHVITLVDGAARLDAYSPVLDPPPPLGSRVRVVGVLGRLDPNGPMPGSGVYWIESSKNLTIIEQPPAPPQMSWWTPERILLALMIPAAVAVLAFIWVFTLRRLIHRQTTELRQQFQMQAELEEKLRTSQKLEAIGRLAGGIAHDFNNLLTVINGCGELLYHDLPGGSQQRDLARDIRSAGERAASLVSQLLLFSRRQSVRLHALNLKPTVREAERILRRVIGETIHVECRLANEELMVRAEPTLIHQILLNLAVNARDAMPTGGTLSIDIAQEEQSARIRVSDTGHGMDEATRKRIFEPFFTTKGIGEGTGLGLATVYGIVQTLKGDIHCQSAVGHGTTFDILIPLLDGSAVASAHASASREVTAGQGAILVCEDDDAVRALTTRILESAGYSVLVAESAADAAQLALSHSGSIDLLLTDVVMPEMNGRELAELIHPLRPEMQVLFMTGYTDDEMVRHGVATIEVDLIGKPFTAAVLTARINAMLTPPRDGGMVSNQQTV